MLCESITYFVAHLESYDETLVILGYICTQSHTFIFTSHNFAEFSTPCNKMK